MSLLSPTVLTQSLNLTYWIWVHISYLTIAVICQRFQRAIDWELHYNQICDKLRLKVQSRKFGRILFCVLIIPTCIIQLCFFIILTNNLQFKPLVVHCLCCGFSINQNLFMALPVFKFHIKRQSLSVLLYDH